MNTESRLAYNIWNGVIRRFSIDTRALGALRISLGFLILSDLLLRILDLQAFYTDSGVLPRSALLERSEFLHRISLHTISGDFLFQVLLFVIAGVFAFALLIGYRTKTATLVSLILLVSLHARNPVLLNGGDSLLRRLLFWSLFLPTGEKWSVDAVKRDEKKSEVTNLATAAILLQVVVIYAVNAVMKFRGDLWLQGDAIKHVFSLDQLTILLGNFLGDFPVLLEFFNYLWLILVTFSFLLILLTGMRRIILVSLFVVMHLGMFLTLRLGLFPLISICALIPFLPQKFWDSIPEKRISYFIEMRQTRFSRLFRKPSNTSIRKFGDKIPKIGFPTSDLSRRLDDWKNLLFPFIISVLLVFVLIWNVSSLGYLNLNTPIDADEHGWDMFAPEPRSSDGWYVVPGKTESGKTVDVFHMSDVEWDRPPDIADEYPSHRWLVYLLDLQRSEYRSLRPYFAGYLCQRWKKKHKDSISKIEIYYVEQTTSRNKPEPIDRKKIWNGTCPRS